MKNESTREMLVELRDMMRLLIKSSTNDDAKLKAIRTMAGLVRAIDQHDQAERREARLQARQDAKGVPAAAAAGLTDDLRTRRENRMRRAAAKGRPA